MKRGTLIVREYRASYRDAICHHARVTLGARLIAEATSDLRDVAVNAAIDEAAEQKVEVSHD